MIKINTVSFTYNQSKKPAIENINMRIEEGQCILLCGKSGCGKTTLTRLFNGLIPNFFQGTLQGDYNIFRLNNQSPIEDYVPHVGSVFQNPKTQYFNTNTTSELAFPCENTGMKSKQIQETIDTCVKKFHLENLINRNIFTLSGGQKQKTAVASANILNPKLLVLDEATSNLDNDAIQELHDMLVQLKKEGVTIILAEHRLAWALDFVDKFYFLEDGQIQHIYSNQEFKELTINQLEQMGLRTNNLEPYKKQIQEKTKIQPNNEILSIENLTIGYKKKTVYTIKNLKLGKNEIVGIMGHNGIGKSTLIKTCCGLLKPIQGEILYEGKKVNAKQLTKLSYLIMQDVNYQLFSDSVINEVLMDNDNEEYDKEILTQLGLHDCIDTHPMALSGGQKQRVTIACALANDKQIIYMDEPTSGLDGYHMNQVGKLIEQLKEKGKTIVIITHDEELAAKWCDRIYSLEDEV